MMVVRSQIRCLETGCSEGRFRILVILTLTIFSYTKKLQLPIQLGATDKRDTFLKSFLKGKLLLKSAIGSI